MKWLNIWLKYLFKGMPKWANTLECKKCKMCFKDAESHFEHVMEKHNKAWDNS